MSSGQKASVAVFGHGVKDGGTSKKGRIVIGQIGIGGILQSSRP